VGNIQDGKDQGCFVRHSSALHVVIEDASDTGQKILANYGVLVKTKCQRLPISDQEQPVNVMWRVGLYSILRVKTGFASLSVNILSQSKRFAHLRPRTLSNCRTSAFDCRDHLSQNNFEMHRHPSQPRRFDSYGAERQPIRPQRFDSRARKSRPDTLCKHTSLTTLCDTREWSRFREPFVDEPPVCPRRSVSPKRSTETRKSSQFLEEISKILSFVLILDLSNLSNESTRVALPPKSQKTTNTNEQHLRHLSSASRGRTPTREQNVDKTPVYSRPPRSPQKISDSLRHSICCKASGCANDSNISLPDLDSTDNS
jgi:hypothetical protein